MTEDQLPGEVGDSISLGNEEQAVEVLLQSVQGLWEVVNNLTRLHPTKKEEFRVTARLGFRLITGFMLRFEILRQS
jgi:hypothetical protein